MSNDQQMDKHQNALKWTPCKVLHLGRLQPLNKAEKACQGQTRHLITKAW
jgi:hypothetical protein